MSFDAVSITMAWRYLRARKRRFAAFITWVSVAGLALGVLVLTVVLSVMNGFDAELKKRILGTVPHVLLPGRSVAEPAVRALLDDPNVERAHDFFVGAGMVTRGGAVNPVSIYGINPLAPGVLPEVSAHMTYGQVRDLADGARGLLMGLPLANHLGLLTGDSVALIVSEPSASGMRPRIERFVLRGTFELGAELDYALVVVTLDDLPTAAPARLGTLGVRLGLSNPLLAAGVAQQLTQAHPDWLVESWSDSYGDFFEAVRLEKLMMFLILLLVVAVAAFNIVSGQMMIVMDKRSDIAILRTIGARSATISRVFLLQGVAVSTIGIAGGLVLGVLTAREISNIVAALKTWFGFGLLDGTFFVEVPSVVHSADLWVIGGLSWVLCLLSAWIPARRAAQLDPIEGLHAG